MRKHLLSSLALSAVLSVPGAASAQTVYDFQKLLFDYDGGQSCMYGALYHVSANGKYAVGYDEEFVPLAYIWCADDPTQLEILGGDDGLRVSACDVTNDGTVVGSWEDLPEGEGKGVCYPAIKTQNGEWTALPVPDNYSEYQAKNQSYANEARAVTPDGKFVVGNLLLETGEKDPVFGQNKVNRLPVLWEDGEIKKVYDDLGINTFQVYDISDDGSIIVGMNQAENGGSNPAIIKDGRLINIFECSEEEDNQNFYGGHCSSIDKDGNVYGYFAEADGSVKYFIYTPDGETKVQNASLACGSGGKTYGMGDLLYSALDCSDDGNVVVGFTAVSIGFGAGMAPQVAVYSSGSGIAGTSVDGGEVNVSWRGGALNISGDYSRAEVYSAAGALVASGSQSDASGVSALAGGTYIIKVTTETGVKSFKIMR